MKEFSLYGPRFSSDDYANDGVLVLRTSDISEAGRVDLTTPPRLILSDEDFERYQAKRGDLLITRTGSLGTVAVLDDDVSAIAGAYLIQYRLAAPIETTWFTFYFLKSPRAQMQLVQRGQGVGRPNLNVPTIDSILIPLPPLAEQIRMMDEIRRLTSVSDELMVDLSAAVQRSVRLRQAILKWAFEGKLVDQYPSDEPADRLLARIRAEPGGAVPKKKSRRPKKGPS
jgi:type I restriction enzyme S subunit